jgi:tRNA uridine 5-carbamoylmethylation protein Kti12
MKTIHIMRGLPGSGKSTESKRIQLRNKKKLKVFRVNLSQLREMLYPENEWSKEFEDIVNQAQRAVAMKMLTLGYDIIVDNTNLGDISYWVSLRQKSIKVLIYDKRDTALDVCLERNEGRRGNSNFIPPQVITTLARKNGLLI